MDDVFLILQWWFMLFILGIVFLQLTTKIFPSFFDKGYIFAKILGIAILSYAVFLLGLIHILPFTRISVLLLIALLFLIFGIRKFKIKERKILISTRFSLGEKMPWKIFFFEEVLLLIGLFFWSFIRSFSPDINGLEKFMDFGFINSILRAEFFPPKDMWLAPFSINYYYFGHLTAAVLTKLSGISSNISYNLMLATIFGLCFTASFSIGANLICFLNPKSEARNPKPSSAKASEGRSKFLLLAGRSLGEGWFRNSNFNIRIFLFGLLTALLVTLSGNLHTVYTFFQPYENEKPVPVLQLAFSPNSFPNGYWYPNATRFIYNTIHEFPIYSWVVADLHGHVFDIPFVLLTIALLLSMFLTSSSSDSLVQNSKFKGQNYNSKFKIFNFGLQFLTFNFKLLTLLGFILAIMYMTNAWDGIIYFLLATFVLAYIIFKPQSSIKEVQSSKFKVQNFNSKVKSFVISVSLIGVSFIIFTLPFSINFKPFVTGIGIVCAPDFLVKIKQIGPFLFEANHCQRSPWWQLLILYGFFYFFVISFLAFIVRKKQVQSSKFKVQSNNAKFKIFNFRLQFLTFNFEFLTKSDIFILLLIIFSTLLIIIPEFVYVKDIYPAHYRANTMFKLVFQAFIMLSIASGYIIMRTISNLKSQISNLTILNKLLVTCYLLLVTILTSLVFIYPYMAIKSYYGELKTFYGLDGTKYLKNSYPSDYEAIKWISKTIKGQPVILEAQGDSYTDYGRVSINTGLPTILGWTVHEWLWRGTYDIPSPRIDEVRKLYEEADGIILQDLIKKYGVKYVFLGDLERQKYVNINEEKWKTLGIIVFQEGNTKIYQLN